MKNGESEAAAAEEEDDEERGFTTLSGRYLVTIFMDSRSKNSAADRISAKSLATWRGEGGEEREEADGQIEEEQERKG